MAALRMIAGTGSNRTFKLGRES
uniref:Uncharacterized protein n=1 Tax=Anguilla anguilla TaxID=7936 RepID=A0A0E9VM48_ANGAN